MSRPKGTEKTGGRQRGTPNKRTLDLSARLTALGSDIDVVLAAAFASKDAEWLKAVVSALPYFAPKLREQDVPPDPAAPPASSPADDLTTAELLALVKPTK